MQNAQMAWKCSKCGYTLTATPPPPETGPACKQKCEFLDVSCYTPDCAGTDQDKRLG